MKILESKISVRDKDLGLLEGIAKHDDQEGRHIVRLEMENGIVFAWHLIDFIRMVDCCGPAGNIPGIKFSGLVSVQAELIAMFKKEQTLYEVIATTRLGVYSTLERGESAEHAMGKATPELQKMAHGEPFTSFRAQKWD